MSLPPLQPVEGGPPGGSEGVDGSAAACLHPRPPQLQPHLGRRDTHRLYRKILRFTTKDEGVLFLSVH